uniref:Uncharacterized protein n=1 Tax=Chlamydomonas leiostraca TaxID=1034604 RepID=A0A7S0X074_9CHLO|mmetsp:Transcript_4912/g.12033  ORF Transcript_4912/g.12033 Transcript_4912/m.12033 type:complete len:158 (+) Transcript_4912:185-658(+)
MSGVERVEYFDNAKNSMVTEQISKEKRIQRNYFREQEAKGLVVPKPPTPPAQHKTLLETVGVPDHLETLRQDPIQSMNTSISKHMWTCNPGYLVRDGPHMTSASKRDFTYDQEELAYLRAQGYLEKTHNRRRDDFVMYVEAASKMTHLLKGGQAATK